MELERLKALCSQWRSSREGFAEIVRGATLSFGSYQYDLAEDFEVSTSTVSRWANGLTAPLPRMQKMIVETIEKRVDRILRGRGGGIRSNGAAAAKSR